MPVRQCRCWVGRGRTGVGHVPAAVQHAHARVVEPEQGQDSRGVVVAAACTFESIQTVHNIRLGAPRLKLGTGIADGREQHSEGRDLSLSQSTLTRDGKEVVDMLQGLL